METIRNSRILPRLVIMLLDVLIVGVSGGLAWLIRFDFNITSIPGELLSVWVDFALVQAAITLAVFTVGHMYSFVWRTVGIHDMLRMVGVVLANFLLAVIVGFIWRPGIPRSVWFISLFFQLIFFVGMRIMPRVYSDFSAYLGMNSREKRERIMVIGGGTAGRMLVNESLSNSKTTGKICCIIDDNPLKRNKYIEGVRIVGGREEIADAVKRYRITQIILAIPSVPAEEQRKILDLCSATPCRVRIVPGIGQLLNGEVSMQAVRDVQIEDLLGRAPITLNNGALSGFLGDRTILVTGGGGSIGSELCRQIAKYSPRRLIIVDIYENNAYDIQQELRRTYGALLDLRVEIASVRDKERIYQIFATYHPDLVFHAAAHKHVPLMENCAAEAVKNNIFGTYHVARAAEKYGVKKFVMISTDKAVNPTNVMGATKRFCEMVLQSRFDSPTEYCAVRFGNVLGSNGSVVPLFKRQIAEGGPVTITDKRIIRYFMTIPEAVSLVLEAGAMAKQSQVFVLDMGDPVKILDLAENLIRLSGLRPYEDIAIIETGLRPGEKLYEELLMASNDLLSTEHKKIFVEQQSRIDRGAILAGLERLDAAVTTEQPNEAIVALLQELIPTYRSPEEVNREHIAAQETDKELVHN